MRAQAYRHRVTVQSQVQVQDPQTGEITTQWLDYVAGVPAEVLTGPGKEMIAADAKQAETSARINMRWFPGLQPTMRIVWQDYLYDILSIESDLTDRRELRVRVKDGLTDGV